MHIRIMAAGLALFIAGPPAFAEEIKPFEIPYKLTDTKHVMVRVKLNGKGPFNFILDTGAPALIMSEAVAKKAGIKIEKGWSKFKLDVEGGVSIPEAKGIAIDMFQLKGMNAMGVAGVELHGVLGYGILARYRIQYDFTQDKLLWTPLKFDPPEIKRINSAKGDGGQGSLEMLGTMMKYLAPLMGLKPNFVVKPRGYLGLELEEKKDQVFVKTVLKYSPADKAGIKVGDQIEHAKSNAVESIEDVLNAVRKLGEGDKLFIRIKRGGEQKDLTIELGKGL
ncbi:MAG: PDZ domain-containing protein [Planctomycetes bacterium]|nr:PDZ domain-containing protein [Planctomycetota bacterium]